MFHNAKKYDNHLICAGLEDVSGVPISVIGQTLENYIAMKIGDLVIKDSLLFMNSSLEKLVQNLAADGDHHFELLKQEYPQNFGKLIRKGVFCYDFLTDETKLDHPSLPPIEAFFNKLTDEALPEEEYKHAQNVWDTFKFKTFREYMELYVKTDVLLLACVFENFRSVCHTHYGLDPANFYGVPGFSWSAMQKFTGVKLELLQDVNMFLFVESSMRGGLSTITKKYAKANNPLLEDYDPKLPESYIMFFDENNLYGGSVVSPVPVSNFRWMEECDLKNFDVMGVPDDGDTGYILEVTLEYPKSLHDLHNDLPLAIQQMVVRDDQLSDYSKFIKEKLDIKSEKTKKLVPNLYNKERYTLHYRNLKFYIRQGLNLVTIHRGIQFRQSNWLKTYIEFNTSLRAQAKNDFEKNLFKLMSNSVYGKSMENVRKYRSIRLINDTRA